MPSIWEDILIILLFLMPFLLIQIFMSTRRKLCWGLVVPILWTIVGIWMIISNYKHDSRHIIELITFFLIGDFVFIGLLLLVRYLKHKKARST